MKNILLATDLPVKDNRHLVMARDLAAKFGSKIWLVHTEAPSSDFKNLEAASQYERDYVAGKLREHHKSLQAMAEELARDGFQAEALLLQGPTVETLLEKAADVKADLIICGLHEHGWFYQVLPGHTASRLMQKSDVPVLTVPLNA